MNGISSLSKCKFKEVFPTEFTDDELRQIKIPALLLIGEKEVIFSPHSEISEGMTEDIKI